MSKSSNAKAVLLRHLGLAELWLHSPINCKPTNTLVYTLSSVLLRPCKYSSIHEDLCPLHVDTVAFVIVNEGVRGTSARMCHLHLQSSLNGLSVT